MGRIHKLKYQEYLVRQVIQYLACKPHSLDIDFVMFLILRGFRCNKTANGIKCPFCNTTFSKSGLELHILNAHYDEVLQLIDEYYKTRVSR